MDRGEIDHMFDQEIGRMTFDMIDLDNDGQISGDEIQLWCKQEGDFLAWCKQAGVSPDEMLQEILRFDMDSDGSISYAEFVTRYQEFVTRGSPPIG
jgi:Ca2+-binding EF-hand superfamily protein